MSEIKIGDHVKIYLNEKFGEREGWYEATVFNIESYSQHRSFYWVQLDEEAREKAGIQQISVFNPKNIQKIEELNG